MRKLGVSVLAFLVSGFVSGLVAQQLAVWSGAGQEFVLVFFVLVTALMMASGGFLVAQFFSPRAVDGMAAGMAALTIAASLVLLLLVGNEAVTPEARHADLWMIGYLGAPVLVMIAVQWLIIRLLAR